MKSEPRSEDASTIRLRPMRQADMSAIMALEQDLFPEDAWTREMFAAEFTQPASRRLYLVAEEADTVIGYGGMMFTGGPQADVVTLAVHPAHWGRGAGTALLCSLVDEADRRGATEGSCEVRATTRGAALYAARAGSRSASPRLLQPSGVDAVVMLKEL